MLDDIRCEKRPGYAVLTMDRPGRRNALGRRSMAALRGVLERLSEDPECRAVVLTGAAPAFCAGSDLREMAALPPEDRPAKEAATAAAVRMLSALPVPVIAAVEGYALGGGFVIATACDLVVSGAGARWSMPEVPNGFFPPWGMAPLIARVGPVAARRIVWGERFQGDEVLRLGIADRLAADGNALAVAEDWALDLAALPPEAVRSVKRFFAPVIAGQAERLDDEASRLFAEDCRSPAAQAVFDKYR